MEALVNAIRRAAMTGVAASVPADLVQGSVVQADPLRVAVEQGLVLEEEDLILPSGCSAAKGDTVALLRAGGGQQYAWLFVCKTQKRS